MDRAPVLSGSSQSLEARAQRCERERTVDDDHEHEGGGILGGAPAAEGHALDNLLARVRGAALRRPEIAQECRRRLEGRCLGRRHSYELVRLAVERQIAHLILQERGEGVRKGVGVVEEAEERRHALRIHKESATYL